jgi:hypothetical protein
MFTYNLYLNTFTLFLFMGGLTMLKLKLCILYYYAVTDYLHFPNKVQVTKLDIISQHNRAGLLLADQMVQSWNHCRKLNKLRQV